MSRRPQDAISQDRLVYELKVAVDRVRRRPTHPPFVTRLRALLAANPRSATSTHVTYNLGKQRRLYLEEHGYLVVQPSTPPPSSESNTQ